MYIIEINTRLENHKEVFSNVIGVSLFFTILDEELCIVTIFLRNTGLVAIFRIHLMVLDFMCFITFFVKTGRITI